MTYTTVKHPKSGETYAVQVLDGEIVRAAGPLHYSDPTDEDSLAALIANQGDEDARRDAYWLSQDGVRVS